MDLTRQEYPALLTGLDPEQAVDVLNGRVAVINKIHSDIADWLQERRRVEEQYATALRKLARRPQQDSASALGVFQMPWQRIVNSVENMAQSHETLAAKIQADVETPLRQYSSTNRELQAMGNMSGNLSSIAKDLSNARKKAQKLDAKGSNKIEGARSDVDDANAQWESQAPFVFEQLQSMDETRVNHLRDVLTQFQTHELDQVERARTSAESCLNALLNVETADEIKTFAARAKSQPKPTENRRASLVGASRPAGANIPPTPPPPRHSNIDQRNNSIPSQDGLAPLPETPKEKKLSGLKRLGTVMGRRKSAAPPPVPSEKKKEKTRSFAPFRRQESSRSFQDLESTGRDLTPVTSQVTSQDGRTSSRQGSERPPQTQESRISDASPPTLNGIGSSQPIVHDSSPPSLPPIAASQAPLVTQPDFAQASPAEEPRTLRPDPFAQALDTTASPVEDPARKLEIKDQPIPEDANAAQQAMDNMANQLRIQAQSSGLGRVQGSVRGRRDVRNTMFIPNPPSHELPSPSATPTLDSAVTPSSATANTSVSTAATSVAPTGSGSELVSPVKRSLGTGSIPEDTHPSSDAHSIHSARSMAGMVHHPEMQSPGLNASIVDTFNTWLSDAGVTRSFVVGEVALAYNRPSPSALDHDTVRLQNFHQLEKCAQNPQFVTASTGDAEPGTYNVALSPISRPIPTVAFKYQLHVDETNIAAFSPILITQAWQMVDGQASAILLYSLNPAFAPFANPGTSPQTSPQELTLKNVAITVSLDTKPTAGTDHLPAKAISAQMMPVQNAHFKKRNGAVVWKFPELLVKATQERLLVRFMIENNGQAKQGGIDLKFEAPNLLASALGVERLSTPAEAGSSSAADPFADDGEAGRTSAEGTEKKWEDVPGRKMLVSGKYSAA